MMARFFLAASIMSKAPQIRCGARLEGGWLIDRSGFRGGRRRLGLRSRESERIYSKRLVDESFGDAPESLEHLGRLFLSQIQSSEVDAIPFDVES
jgi:hypothetical protein